METAKEMLGSIKGKVWFAVSAFAVLNCVVGLLAYLAASYITASTFFLVLIPFLLTSAAQIFFGRWLSGEVVEPIEKASLLARSIERTPAGSLPRSTGALETDELLEAIHRNARQVQNIVTLMESVANGDTSTPAASLENPDRLTASFQKLVSKVKESVNAKSELDTMRATMGQMTSAVSQVRNGKADASGAVPADFDRVIRDVNDLVEKVSLSTSRAKNTADKVRTTIAAVIEKEETAVRDLNRTAFDFGKSSSSLQNLTKELAEAIASTRGLVEKTWQNPESSKQNSNATTLLRKLVKGALSRLQAISETSNGIAGISESAEDLARRTNLIALNVSLQGKEPNSSKRASSLLTAEVEGLAERSNAINKEITEINNAIAAEIKEVEKALQSTLGEIANLNAFAIESENAVGKFGSQFDQLAEIQDKLVDTSTKNSSEVDASFRELTVAMTQSEQSANQLKESEAHLDEFVRMMDDLNAAVGRFRDVEEPIAEVLVAERPKKGYTFSDTEESETSGSDLPKIEIFAVKEPKKEYTFSDPGEIEVSTFDLPEAEVLIAEEPKKEYTFSGPEELESSMLDLPKATTLNAKSLPEKNNHKVDYLPHADRLGANELLEI